MENLYKYFSSLYKHYRIIVINKLIHIGMLGFQFAFFLSRNSVFQSIYRVLFLKRPRDSEDILIEPVDNPHWLCKSQIIHTTTSSKKTIFNFKKSSLPLSESFDLKEEYHLPPFSYQENVKYDKETVLWTYSIYMTIENISKQFRIIKPQPLTEIEYENLTPQFSSISFLDIQYHHPKMKESLILEVPKEWCCINNHLFTPVFVLRMLYYQTLPFVFDMSYNLEIMDSNLNMLTLNSSQSLVLKKDSYDVL